MGNPFINHFLHDPTIFNISAIFLKPPIIENGNVIEKIKLTPILMEKCKADSFKNAF